MESYSISQFADEAQQIVAYYDAPKPILKELSPLLRRLASDRAWFDPKMLRPTLKNGAASIHCSTPPAPDCQSEPSACNQGRPQGH